MSDTTGLQVDEQQFTPNEVSWDNEKNELVILFDAGPFDGVMRVPLDALEYCGFSRVPPTPPPEPCQPSQPLAAEQEDAADRAAVAASKAEGVFVPLDQALAEVDQPLAAGDLRLREGGWYRRRDGQVVGPAVQRDETYRQRWLVGGESYWDNGTWNMLHFETSYDLITEVPDPSWQPHDGGQCPVSLSTLVEVRFRNGGTSKTKAGDACWTNYCNGTGELEIIAWRLAEENGK